MERWRSVEQSVLTWLATTATGSFVKVALGGLLAYVAAIVGDWDMPAWLAVVITAAVPVAINTFNPDDGRYGVIYVRYEVAG